MKRQLTDRLSRALGRLSPSDRRNFKQVFAEYAEMTEHPHLAELMLGLRAELFNLDMQEARDRDALASLEDAYRAELTDIELRVFGEHPPVTGSAWWPDCGGPDTE